MAAIVPVRRGRAAVPEWLNDLVPGVRYVVWYGDDSMWHERIALWPLRPPASWIHLTPDGDLYGESLDGSDGPHGITQALPLLQDGMILTHWANRIYM